MKCIVGFILVLILSSCFFLNKTDDFGQVESYYIKKNNESALWSYDLLDTMSLMVSIDGKEYEVLNCNDTLILEGKDRDLEKIKKQKYLKVTLTNENLCYHTIILNVFRSEQDTVEDRLIYFQEIVTNSKNHNKLNVEGESYLLSLILDNDNVENKLYGYYVKLIKCDDYTGEYSDIDNYFSSIQLQEIIFRSR